MKNKKTTINPEMRKNVSNFSLNRIMVDKIIAIKRDKICNKVGELSKKEQDRLDKALKLWLNIDSKN